MKGLGELPAEASSCIKLQFNPSPQYTVSPVNVHHSICILYKNMQTDSN